MKVVLIAVLTASLAGCDSYRGLFGEKGGELPRDVVALGPGWQCVLAPTSFDPPGTVFRIDDRGVRYRVRDLSGQITIEEGAAYVGTVETTDEFNASFDIDLLKEAIPNFTASLDATTDAKRKSLVVFGGTSQEVTFDDAADMVLDWFNAYERKRPNNNYYLIREALLANSINYDLQRSTVSALGGAARFSEIVDANANLEDWDEDSYRLTQVLTDPVRVCFKPEELVLTRDARGKEQYVRQPVTEILQITREGAPDQS